MFDGDSRPKSVPQGFANTQKQEEGPERQRRQRVSRRPFLFVGDGFGDPLPLLSGGASFRFSCAGETLRHWLRPRVPVKDRALLDRALLS